MRRKILSYTLVCLLFPIIIFAQYADRKMHRPDSLYDMFPHQKFERSYLQNRIQGEGGLPESLEGRSFDDDRFIPPHLRERYSRLKPDIDNPMQLDGDSREQMRLLDKEERKIDKQATQNYHTGPASILSGSVVEAWVEHYTARLGPSNNITSAMVIDTSDGSIYVTGSSDSAGAYNYLTVKYSSDGNLIWTIQYDGLGNSDDYATAIAIDGQGNVYVTGRSSGSGSYMDYATIKYNSSGAQQWVRRYNGPANSTDQATAIALDGQENVYVTGESVGSGTSDDFATIKYNSSGVEQWVSRYNDLGNATDRAKAIVVDGGGDAYVTGSSFTGNDSYITIIKYIDSFVSPKSFRVTLQQGENKDTILSIRNIKNNNLTWSLTEVPSVDWFSAYPSNGTIAPKNQTDVALSIITTNLNYGTYQCTLEIHTGDPVDSVIYVQVIINVKEVFIGSLSGTVFNDLNGNGIREASELPLIGWKIILGDSIGAIIDSLVTDTTGYYIFKLLPDGKYTVRQEIMQNWQQTFPWVKNFYLVTIEGGKSSEGLDFGNFYNGIPPSPVFSFTIHGIDYGGQRDSTKFGVNSAATFCFDPGLGEQVLPLPPWNPYFDLRWIDPRGNSGTCFSTGINRDIRPFNSNTQIDTFKLSFGPGWGGFPFTFRWSGELSRHCDSMKLFYYGSTAQDVIIDMFSVASHTITDSTVRTLQIIKWGAKDTVSCFGPDLISPANVAVNQPLMVDLN